MSNARRAHLQTRVGQVIGGFFLSGVFSLALVFALAKLLPITAAGRLAILFSAWTPVWAALMCWYALRTHRGLFWTMHGALMLVGLIEFVRT